MYCILCDEYIDTPITYWSLSSEGSGWSYSNYTYYYTSCCDSSCPGGSYCLRMTGEMTMTSDTFYGLSSFSYLEISALIKADGPMTTNDACIINVDVDGYGYEMLAGIYNMTTDNDTILGGVFPFKTIGYSVTIQLQRIGGVTCYFSDIQFQGIQYPTPEPTPQR